MHQNGPYLYETVCGLLEKNEIEWKVTMMMVVLGKEVIEMEITNGVK